MKIIIKIVLFFIMVFGFVVCFKEKKIECIFFKNDGIWDVISVYYMYYFYDLLVYDIIWYD